MRCCRIVNRNILTRIEACLQSLRTIALLRIEIYCMGTLLYQSGMPVFFFIAFLLGNFIWIWYSIGGGLFCYTEDTVPLSLTLSPSTFRFHFIFRYLPVCVSPQLIC